MTLRPWHYVAATLFAIAWGGNEFTPLLVLYRLDGMNPVTVDFLLFAYVLGIIPALAVAGPLSDRIGRRPVLLPAPWLAVLGTSFLALGANSPALLALGRALCGIALGIAMAAGGSWLKELSTQPFDPAADGLAGPRRQGMSLTLGFAIGAVVAACIAQWAAFPHVLPYLLHIALVIPVGLALMQVPETRSPAPESAPTITGSAMAASTGKPATPAAAVNGFAAVRHRRFRRVILLLAPWVFGAGGVAYAVIPSLLTPAVPGAPIAFSGLLCLIALGSGFLIQNLARRIYVPGTIRLPLVAYGFLLLGMIVAVCTALALPSGSPAVLLGLIAALILGAGYGTTLQSCLLEVQHLATARNLAALTAAFYALAYLGFAFPMVLAWLSDYLSYAVMLGVGVVVLAVSALILTAQSALAARTAKENIE